MSFSVNWLPETAYIFMLIFARVGTMLMLLPALGERFIPARIRLGFALVFSMVLFPIVSPFLPAIGGDLNLALAMLGHEIIVGLILGTLVRLITSATQVAGATVAFQIGLSMAQTADPSQNGVQGAVIGNFISMLALAMIFAMDLHHLLLAAIRDSYMLFSPDAPLMFEDAAQLAIGIISRAFALGVQMSAPFIVFGLVFNLGLGLLAKLMPQLQVFFLAMPVNLGVGFVLFALLITMMMGWYLSHFQGELSMLIQ